eukprot:7539492-Heterocapsa_arctica.AAC.1
MINRSPQLSNSDQFWGSRVTSDVSRAHRAHGRSRFSDLLPSYTVVRGPTNFSLLLTLGGLEGPPKSYLNRNL